MSESTIIKQKSCTSSEVQDFLIGHLKPTSIYNCSESFPNGRTLITQTNTYPFHKSAIPSSEKYPATSVIATATTPNTIIQVG